MDVARRSIARISFKWEREQKNQVVPITTSKSRKKKKVVPDKKTFIVIPGVILTKEGDSHIMILDNTFFIEGFITDMEVQLPTADGYAPVSSGGYEKIEIQLGNLDNLHVYRVNHPNLFTAPVQLETKALKQQDIVHAFVFPRDPHMPYSTGFCSGCIIFENSEVVFNGCGFHEYSHFGSPIFNEKGHLVGICYASQTRTHTWPGKLLQETLAYVSSTIGIVPYLYDGAGSEDQG